MLACCLMAAAWSLTSASASGNVWANTPGNKRNESKNGRIGTSDSNRSIVPPAPIRAGRVGERATVDRGPLSPRRTGDADFPRPALLKALASGMRCPRLGRASQTHQPQPLQMRVPRFSFRRSIGPLTAPLEMPDQTAAYEPVDFPVHALGIPKGKIVRPPFQMPIQLSNQFRDRLKALMTVRHLVQLFPFPLDCFLRRKHIQVPLIASLQIPIIPKCVPQKVQARPFFPQIHHPRLFPVDLQLELPFQP